MNKVLETHPKTFKITSVIRMDGNMRKGFICNLLATKLMRSFLNQFINLSVIVEFWKEYSSIKKTRSGKRKSVNDSKKNKPDPITQPHGTTNKDLRIKREYH